MPGFRSTCGAQVVMWPFEQRNNLATSQHPIFQAGSVVYLAGELSWFDT